MHVRKILSASALALMAAMTMVQDPTDAVGQASKADKRKALKKALAAKKAEPPAKPVPSDAKPAPEAKRPTAPANPMPTVDLARLIDREIDRRLAEAKIKPSPSASDAEFLRRVYLDIAGVVPTREQAVEFLDDRATDKRAKLIDRLLNEPAYGHRMADIWTGLLFITDSDTRFLDKRQLRDWLAGQFNKNSPWDGLAYDLITATGDPDDNGATVYLLSNRGVDKMTDSVGKLFLGVQIQCAQCHNHPFTHWKQSEYWGLAQFFYKVNLPNPRAAKNGGNVSVSETAQVNRRFNPLPESAKDETPKLLGGDKLALNAAKPYRPVLAQWICSPSNPFFAKAFVNRLWSQYMGRGFVNPVDDLSDENAPSHPELLQALAREFGASGFDIKHLIRGICNSEAYQRTSKPTASNRDDQALWSHQALKVLRPEQLFDSLSAVLGPIGGGNNPMRKAAPKGPPQTPRDQFMAFFAGTDSAKPTDYEAGIPQALRLMNNPMMNNARLTNATAKAADLAKGTPAETIERLYLTALARRPTAEETQRMADFVRKQSDPKTAYADVLWVLLNSSEFALNR